MLAVVELLTPAAFAAVRLFTAATIYLAVLKAGIVVAHAFENEVYAKLPLLEFFAKSIGVALTVLVFIEWYGEGAFAIDTLFGPDSYWRLDLTGFLAHAANPFQHVPWEVLSDPTSLSAIMFYAALAAFLVALFVMLPAGDALRTMFVSFIYIALTVYTFVYFAAFALWSLYTLNFWACIVIILVLTYARR